MQLLQQKNYQSKWYINERREHLLRLLYLQNKLKTEKEKKK